MVTTDRILVTGAAGFVGGHLIDRLQAEDKHVVGWYRPGGDTSRLRAGVEWMPVDLLDRAAVSRAVTNMSAEAVYHLAGAAHVAHSWRIATETYQKNVLATHHLLAALRDASSSARVLVACSATVYRPQNRPLTEADAVGPTSPYATSKLAQELLAVRAFRDEGVATLIARSFNHTGPGQDPSYVAPGIARQIARIEAGMQEPILRLGNLEPRRDLTDVRDVARAYVAMMTHATPGIPYNVSSGRELAIRTLVETFVTRARAAVRIEQDRALLRPNDIPLLVGSHDRLTADTGWTPQVPLEHTIDDLLNHWRDQIRR